MYDEQTKDNRLSMLRRDEDIEEVSDRIFFVKHNRQIKSDIGEFKWEALTIKEVMTIWGYESFYEQMIENFKRKIANHPEEDIVVHYDTGGLKKEIEHQKLLGWSIWNQDEKRYVLIGGVLFQNNEMSFHT